MKKPLKIIFFSIIILLILGAVGIFSINLWQKKKLEIKLGLAKKTFPFTRWTQEELNKMYPQIKYADVQTRITPEQTYAKFRQALKENNLEMAIEQLAKESKRYGENKNSIEKAYKENKLKEIYKEYPEKIEKEYIAESIAQFYFLEKKNNEITRYSLNFQKNAQGDWQLDSL